MPIKNNSKKKKIVKTKKSVGHSKAAKTVHPDKKKKENDALKIQQHISLGMPVSQEEFEKMKKDAERPDKDK